MEFLSETPVISPRRQMERWWKPAGTSCPVQRASSVEDPGGVGDDPGVGHEPGVDPDVGDPLVPLLLARAVLRELVQGEGHLARGQPHVERKFLILGFIRMLAGNVVPLDDFASAEIFVLVDVLQIVAGIIAPLSICRLGSGLGFFASVGWRKFLPPQDCVLPVVLCQPISAKRTFRFLEIFGENH